MKGFENNQYVILYIIANLLAAGLAIASWKRPGLGRLFYFLLFGWACWINWKTVTHTPEVYLEYAELSFLSVYQEFIHGWFSGHIHLQVGAIATCQGFIAFSMLMKGWILRIGSTGAILFLLAIIPFGVGSGFPATLIMAIGVWLIIRRDDQDFLWKQIRR